MVENIRKKSPRAPSIELQEALDRALKIYDKERRHAAPTDVVAQDMGYKSANSGKALSALASLRYYGLLERSKNGQLAITKDVEAYRFDPSEDARRQLLRQFVRSPQVFGELLDKYADGLPSNANLRFDLIQRGFMPVAAESLIGIFTRSIEFADYFGAPDGSEMDRPDESPQEVAPNNSLPNDKARDPNPESEDVPRALRSEALNETVDRIPVRLPQGRRAWLIIPTPFFAADKSRLKAHIDLILTDD